MSDVPRENVQEYRANAFQAVSHIFTGTKEVPLELEILRDRSVNIVRDANAVGVPRMLLYAAMSCVLASQDVNPSHAIRRQPLSSEASSVLLLANPEHLTAANGRKRSICKIAKSADREPLQQAVKDELWLLDTFLTSPLYRHAKSPTLWSHRRWLISEYLETIIQIRNSKELPKSSCVNGPFMEHELQVVLRAGTQHPKNYPAWDYARTVVNILKANEPLEQGDLNLSKVLLRTHSWCLSHPTDTSGWSFLWFLLSQSSNTLDVGAQLVQKTLDTSLSFRWSSEAVWSFLRVTLASEKYLSCRQNMVERLEACMIDLQKSNAISTNSAELSVAAESIKLLLVRIEQALHWIRKNKVCINSTS